MSKLKEKRLRRMRNQKIWPHVLGLFLMIIVFLMMISGVFAIIFTNIFSSKIKQAYTSSDNIVQLVDSKWDGIDTEILNEFGENFTKSTPNLQDMCVLDENGNVVYSYSGYAPKEDLLEFYKEDDVGIYLANDVDGIIYVEDDVINFGLENLDFGKLLKAEEDEENVEQEYTWEDEIFTHIVLWYTMPLTNNSGDLCLKNDIIITKEEAEFAVIAIIIVAALALVLIVYYFIAVVNLIHEKKKMTKVLQTDDMTGGNNFTYLFSEAARRLRKRKNQKVDYALVSFRMEKYQSFCICYGVKEGEELMERFYDVLKKKITKAEIIAHGENANFALLLQYASKEDLEIRLSEMMSALEGIKENQKMYFCAGIYEVEKGRRDIERMYTCAKIACSQITHDNDVRVYWFNEELQKEQLWSRKVEDDMANALVNKEFKVYLQPKYSTKEEKLSGAEALVRWIHPTEGFIPPNKFIPIFESNGFIIQLDDYMISEVAKQQAQWISEGEKIVPISVNISRAHFSKEDLAEHICELVDKYGVPHDVIELELTESAFFDDKDMLLKTINKLKYYGFTISMDDFGAGYSSLNSLKELPLDVVKLDAEFFRNVDENGRGDLIVGDTIALAKKLDMRIVAEGIETREQVDFLAAKDCDLIQGYYFAKPMPVEEFEKMEK